MPNEVIKSSDVIGVSCEFRLWLPWVLGVDALQRARSKARWILSAMCTSVALVPCAVTVSVPPQPSARLCIWFFL